MYYIVYLLLFCNIVFNEYSGATPYLECRNSRSCANSREYNNQQWKKGWLRNGFMLFLLILMALILFLIALGLLKGLIGLVCFSTIGMCGLTLLANLPCRLDKYYEPDLSDCIVEYDDSGWPVHPQTHRRTVRLMSRKAEFCLNTIFFLAYPLVALSALCDYCCGSPVCDTDSNSLESKRIVRVARFSNMEASGPTIDMYGDGDPSEVQDTRYVVSQMNRSKESLQANAYDE